MKLLRYTYTALILMAVLFSFGSCTDDDDDTKLSKAVLAGVSSLNFEGDDNIQQIITIYADAEWIVETPEWITVEPASGKGVMDVAIGVSENMRDGALDNPRRGVVVFKGATLDSEAKVVVLQAGDKYRGVKDYTLEEVVGLDDETVVSVPDATVMAVLSRGYIVSDEQNANNVYILGESSVNVGDKVSIRGTKSSNTQSLAVVNADQTEITSTGGTVTYPEAKDITENVDTYNATYREFIAVNGVLNGNNVSVDGANYTVSIVNAPSSLNLNNLTGHRVTVKGYFDGLSAPVVRVLPADIQDEGVDKVIYFFEDFEWLDPWSKSVSAGRTVETDDPGAYSPRITTPIVDGVAAVDALLAKGYDFLRVTPTTTEAGECIYLQENYLKFGRTGYQAGIILPKLEEDIPSDVTPTMSFDWCPQRQGSGIIDPVNLIIIIKNGDNEVTFDIPESGFEQHQKLEWIKAEVELTGVEITKETKITIRQTNWQLPTANRYFLDNIEISSAAN